MLGLGLGFMQDKLLNLRFLVNKSGEVGLILKAADEWVEVDVFLI